MMQKSKQLRPASATVAEAMAAEGQSQVASSMTPEELDRPPLTGDEPQACSSGRCDDVIGHVPRYAMPNISSMLPTYTNAEQDFVHRTFHVGNYDSLKHLPDNIREQQVMAMRAARMEAARRFLMPVISGPLLKSRDDNQQGLFSAFEYIPTRYNIADELAAKERVESEAKRLAIGGHEFIPTSTLNIAKHQDLEQGKRYPYLGGPHEALDDTKTAHRWAEDAKMLGPLPFVNPGVDKLDDRPTKQAAWEMMNNIRKWILQDWQGASINIFENHQDCWVLQIALDSIDSQPGMVAYMNVFIRCNELVTKYQLSKVVEFWNTTPDDGNIYFVMRPPWVHLDRIEPFFTLHPEERTWSTSHAVVELQKTRPHKEIADDDGGTANLPSQIASSLRFGSRLEWGVNFYTNTPSAAKLSKIVS